MKHTVLSRRSGPFFVLVVVGLVVGAVALHAIGLWFQLSTGDRANYASDVGAGMFGFVAGAVILVVLGLVAALMWERHGEWGRLTGAAAAGVVAIILCGVAEARTWSAMHNFGPQLRALSRFEAPAAWPGPKVRTQAARNPGAQATWTVTSAFEDVRDPAVAAFTAWADPGTVIARAAATLAPGQEQEQEREQQHAYAVLDGRRGWDRAELWVASDPLRPGVVMVRLAVAAEPSACCA